MTQPVLYIIAGANGSGKTTFAMRFTQLQSLPFINADEIAKALDSDHLEKVRIQAGRVFFDELETNLQEGESFAIESTLSGRYLTKVINRAKEMSYQVHIIYLYLNDPAINIGRVKTRVLAGGHDVPEIDIIRRFHRSRHLFWNTYRHLCDEWILVYNSDESFDEVAYGSLSSHTVLNQLLFDDFVKGLPDETR